MSAGMDGPTYCVVADSGTAVDLLAEDDASEADWRNAFRVHRFLTLAERERFISAQPWHAWAAERGRPGGDDGRELPVQVQGAIDLQLRAGLSNSEVSVQIGIGEKGNAGRYLVRLGELEPKDTVELRGSRRLERDEAARYIAELRLLGVSRWTQYPLGAVDGLSWSLTQRMSGPPKRSSGINAYPTHGDRDPSPEFVRLLLATERLLGRELWPGFDVRGALDSIPDERDRVEHLLLHGLRGWASAFERSDGDPMATTEVAFEKTLVLHLAELVGARRQINVKEQMTGWPGVGSLDIELAETDPQTWVELKWAKAAGTLFNCLWDVGKLAQAICEGRAAYGYLVAGAPVAEWRKDTPYRRLFGVSCHLDGALVTQYERRGAAGGRRTRTPSRSRCRRRSSPSPSDGCASSPRLASRGRSGSLASSRRAKRVSRRAPSSRDHRRVRARLSCQTSIVACHY